MSIDYKELVSFAEGHAGSACEVTRRAAVSRAYYGAYHAVTPWLEQLCPVEKNPVTGHIPHKTALYALLHWKVLPTAEQFKIFATQAKRAGLSYSAMLDRRVMADYRLSSDVTDSDVASQCAAFSAVKQLCAQLELKSQAA